MTGLKKARKPNPPGIHLKLNLMLRSVIST